jgi:hypothetical protein
MLSFRSELYDAFKRVKGYPLSFIAIVLAIVMYIWEPETSLPLKIVIPISIILLLIIFILIDLSLHCFSKMINIIPPVRYCQKAIKIGKDGIAILLIDNSALFSPDTLISVYYRDEFYEPLIGLGFVLTIQENKLIQVLIDTCVNTQYDEIWARACENNKSTLEKLIVKPSIPKQY